MAEVDNSAWDAGKAWAAGAASDNPAAFYNAICAGKKSGDPATQAAHALPHHYHPGDPPNAAGVRNGLSRLPQTQDLTNKAAAQAHLEAHMKVISPDSAKSAAPAQARAAALGDRAALGDVTARLEPFRASWEHRAVDVNGKPFAQLDGYASVTGIEYEMWDVFGPYGETIHPAAFDGTLGASPDVAFLVNHKGLVMARTKNPSGDPTLLLDADPRGLHSRAYVNPERTDVRDLLHAIDDGMVTEMSFAFQLDEGEWDEEFEHFTITRVNIDRGDVSAVNYGANPYTSIGARARSILGELAYLPAGAQRAAMAYLTDALDLRDPAAVSDVAREAGCEDEIERAQEEHRDAQIPVDVTLRGKSVDFYEAMLRL